MESRNCKYCNAEFKGHFNSLFCDIRCKRKFHAQFKRPRSIERARSNDYRKRHKDLGLCIRCTKKAIKSHLCEIHLKRQKRISRKSVAKRDYGKLWELQVCILDINDEARRRK